MRKRRVNGPTIVALREARGMRQADLARASGISRPHINQIEAGLKQPSEKLIPLLAAALGVPEAAITYPMPHLVVA